MTSSRPSKLRLPRPGPRTPRRANGGGSSTPAPETAPATPQQPAPPAPEPREPTAPASIATSHGSFCAVGVEDAARRQPASSVADIAVDERPTRSVDGKW